MSRSTRSRRVPLKYSTEEFVVEAKRTRKKKSEPFGTDGLPGIKKVTDETESAENERIGATKLRNKGNFGTGNLSVLKSPVLRDRTNLPDEFHKIDVSMKKGTRDEAKGATTRKMRSGREKLKIVEAEREETQKSVATRTKREETEIATTVREKTQRSRARRLEPSKLVKDVDVRDEKNEESDVVKKMVTRGKRDVPSDNGIVGSKTKLLKKSEKEEETAVLKKARGKKSEKEGETAVLRKAMGKKSEKEGETAILKKATLKKSVKDGEVENKRYQSRSTEGKDGQGIARKPNNVAVMKKFFKSKAAPQEGQDEMIEQIEKIMPIKRRKIGVRQRPRVSTSFRLRQTTLQESFRKQAIKKNLRPRQTQKNYRDDTIVSDKSLGKNENENDIKKKGPIYKLVQSPTKNSAKDTNEIYEFNFDSNDSRERIKKKTKKKRVAKRILTKKTKAIALKMTPKLIRNNVDTKKVDEKKIAKPEKNEEKVVKIPAETTKPAAISVAVIETPVEMENDFILPEIVSEKKVDGKNDEKAIVKPKIVESVHLKGDNVISLMETPQPMKSVQSEFRPFRVTNAFDKARPSVQYKTMMNHALLNKSLSPISKAVQNFDPGSPWRPPTFTSQQFFRVKNVVQSTPQVRKFTDMLEKNSSDRESSSNVIRPSESKMTKIFEKNDENANVSQKFDKSSPVKVAAIGKSPRKFGTEISNVNNSIPSVINETSDRSELSRVSPKKMTIPQVVDNIGTEISERREFITENLDENAENKENSIPASKSPKKSPSKITKKIIAKSNLPQRYNDIFAPSMHKFQPQPGPSGLQKQNLLEESRILKQSNLNNFLNIDEMPKSTRISTVHGIFNDAHSTPINGKTIKKIFNEPNVENAFGFDDGDSEIDFSPIKRQNSVETATKKVTTKIGKMEEKRNDVVNARLSIGEIKKTILPVKKKTNVLENAIERDEEEEPETCDSKKTELSPREKEAADSIAFADTFDLMPELNELENKENQDELPLFADLEPVHFKQPPRHSYKRKRAVKFSFSEDEEENKAAETGNRRTKKRKISKVEKQREKKLNAWAKNLNETFDEIDHFDLVVE